MQNISEFRIIGRIGKITRNEKVSYLDIAANYRRKAGDRWEDDTHWSTVTLFGKLHERAERLGQGDLVHVTGQVRQNRFEKNGETRYSVDMIAERLGVILRKQGNTTDGAQRGQGTDDLDDEVPF